VSVLEYSSVRVTELIFTLGCVLFIYVVVNLFRSLDFVRAIRVVRAFLAILVVLPLMPLHVVDPSKICIAVVKLPVTFDVTASGIWATLCYGLRHGGTELSKTRMRTPKT
jgi:hypothetical protein